MVYEKLAKCACAVIGVCCVGGLAHLVEEHAGQAREQAGVGALHQQVRHVGSTAREEHKRLQVRWIKGGSVYMEGTM